MESLGCFRKSLAPGPENIGREGLPGLRFCSAVISPHPYHLGTWESWGHKSAPRTCPVRSGALPPKGQAPGARDSKRRGARAREISERRNEETMQTESGQHHSESVSVRNEEIHVVGDGKKRGKYLPRELRIKTYNDAHKLRKRGLSNDEIRNELYRTYGVWIHESTIIEWLSGKHDPRNGRRIPSIEMLEPSEDLAHSIGMRFGDGSAWEARRAYEGYREAAISLKAKDKEFVEESAIRVARVLGCRPPKVYFDVSTDSYYFIIRSRTLYELLKKPIDIKKLRKYTEHSPKCMAACLRAFFDSEGSVNDNGVITVGNGNYRLLKYVQYLLRKFGITAKGPELVHRQGSIMYIEGSNDADAMYTVSI
jgi:intein-encoded DNA endonuclease-like protein